MKMIIISARKFRDSQNEILKKALSEEVILTTLHFGNFRLVPIAENKTDDSETEPVRKKSRTVKSKVIVSMQDQPSVSGPAPESGTAAENLAVAAMEKNDASAKYPAPVSPAASAGDTAAERSAAASKASASRNADNLLFPDLFTSIEFEPKPEPESLSASAPETPELKPKARSRKTSDPSRRRGKALPSSVSGTGPDFGTQVMSNIPQWASGSDAASVSRKPEAPALTEVVVEPDASAHSPAPYAGSAAAGTAPAFEGGEGDYSDRFDDNGNPRLVSAGKHARDTREDPMSEEERTAAFERLRERARQVREGAPQKASASESPAEPATHPSGPASAARPAAALHPDADASAAYPEASAAEPNASAPAEPKTKDANVYVDPSLMSLDEYYKQAGIEIEPQKKGGFFSKFFGKK